jgi:hypothetical protein
MSCSSGTGQTIVELTTEVRTSFRITSERFRHPLELKATRCNSLTVLIQVTVVRTPQIRPWEGSNKDDGTIQTALSHAPLTSVVQRPVGLSM